MNLKCAVFLIVSFLFSAVPPLKAADKPALSVLYFENLNPGTGTNFLNKALAEMLVADLAQVKELVLIEREGLEKVLREMELGASGLVDEKSAPKIGKLLGATHLVSGNFLADDKGAVLVNYKILGVEGGQIQAGGSVTGSKENLIQLKDSLSASVYAALKKMFPVLQGPASFATGGKAGLDEVEKFGQALEFSDRGDLQKAGTLLKNLASQSPNFTPARAKIAEIEKRIKEYDQKHEAALNKTGSGAITFNDFMKTSTSLMGGSKYTQMLAYCRRVQKNPPEAPAGAVLNSKELADYYVAFSLYMLKRWDSFPAEAESFLKNYPDSMYYTAVKGFLTQALGDLKTRDTKLKKVKESIKENVAKLATATSDEKNLLRYQIANEYFGSAFHAEALTWFRQIDRAALEEKYKITGDMVLYSMFMCYHGLLMKEDALRVQKTLETFYPESDMNQTVATMMNYFPE